MPSSPPKKQAMKPKFRITFDGAICSGCRCCELACSLFHEGQCNPFLARIHVTPKVFEGENNEVTFCRQCPDPACLHACPVEGALIVDERTGARIIDQSVCVGCGKCADACPLNTGGWVIRLHSEKKVYIKCDLCRERDEGPACVEACPWGALKYEKTR